MQFALKGALGRAEALNIRPIDFEFIVHPGRDGGARKTGPDLLRLEQQRFRHALLVLDFEGSGTDAPDANVLESELDNKLAVSWNTSGKSIVIDPELDVWVWGGDNAVQTAINWPLDEPLREWLQKQGFTLDDVDKPIRPKEALETALKQVGLPRSSAVYQTIAERISLRRCKDPAFLRLWKTLTSWFPPEKH